MLGRLGVRGRLLLAFFGISSFAILAAAAAIYSFLVIGEVLDRITERRIPSALASQSLSRQAERTVVAAEKLLTLGSAEEHAELSAGIAAEVKTLNQLLEELRSTDVEPESFADIESFVRWLSLNIIALDNLGFSRVSLVELKRERMLELVETSLAIRQLLSPEILDMGKTISGLREGIDTSGPATQDQALALVELSKATDLLFPLHAVQGDVSYIGETLRQSASFQSTADLENVVLSLQESLENLRQQTEVVEPPLRENLLPYSDKLSGFVEGRSSIPELRKNELDLTAIAEQQLSDYRDVARQLTEALNTLVGTANRDMQDATLEALGVQRFSTQALVALAILSFISSLLIVWLYVDRNLVSRLSALSDSMLAIAKGNLKAEIPSARDDEIGSMTEALKVFRDTAIEVEESNLREIREARRRLTDAIESITEGFSLYDKDDRLVLCNSTYHDLLYPGMRDVMVPGTPFEDIIRSAVGRGLIQVAEGRVDAWVDERMAQHRNPGEGHLQRRGDGRWIQIHERRTEDGGTVAVYSDITELKEREQELADLVEKLELARDQAEAATVAKSQFLANMSHELRTPLNAVMGFSEVLLDKVAAEGQAQFQDPLKRIHGAGAHLLKLINDILDLAKIEAGKMDLKIEPISVSQLLHEAVTTVRPMAESNNNRLSLNCPQEVGSIRADPVRARQILLNLLSNAAKFTEDGQITVDARRSHDGSDRIVIAVSDTGIGMEADQIVQLFSEFVQLDDASTRKHGGTGLGLAISRRLCRLMGGEITVQSKPGAGSTFTIGLPAVADAVLRSAPQRRRYTGTASPAAPPPGELSETTRVLVIDDDPSARELLEMVLASKGHQVTTASDGEIGLRLAREIRPAVITLDVLMPEPNGWSVLSALKADPQVADIPVIMVTIVDEPTRGYALGAADYITKPVDRNRLLTVVNRHASTGRRSILIVEDEEATRAMLRRTLEKADYSVTEASNSENALECLAEAVPDLILLDLILPEMNGFDFLTTLRRDASWHAIPVVVITARDLGEEDHRRLNGEVARILQKDAYAEDRLVGEIQALIDASLTRSLDMEHGQSRTILYVEDNEDNVVLLKGRLEQHGFEVIVATDGEQGVAMAKDQAPGVILMDMRLPVMDGWEATKALKAAPETRAIPIIGVSAHAMVGDREKAIEAGCDDYITKPVDLPGLLKRLDELMGSDDRLS